MSVNPAKTLITAPVGVYDVQQVLATSDNDVGRLCVNSAINMWARYKPLKIRRYVPMGTDTRRALYYGLSTIRADAQPFGDFFTDVKNMIASAGRDGRKWGIRYNKPTGGTVSPYRLDDFACVENNNLGYYHNAELYHSPIGGNYSIPLTYRPLLDGYTESRSMETVEVSRSDNPITIPTDVQQERNAWEDYSPERSVAGDTGTPKQLSVTAFDIMCNSAADKVNFYNNGTMQMRRGFMITDGSSLLKWGVGEIPFASWLGMEGGLTGTWFFAEFYTDVQDGNYNGNTTQVGTYILIPAAFGQIEIVTAAGTSEFINLGTGNVTSNNQLEISFQLVSPQAEFIANYRQIRVSCDCNNTAHTEGATFYNNYPVNASYFQNTTVWENFIPNATPYRGFEIHLYVYGDRVNGESETLLSYHGIINQ